MEITNQNISTHERGHFLEVLMLLPNVAAEEALLNRSQLFYKISPRDTLGDINVLSNIAMIILRQL